MIKFASMEGSPVTPIARNRELRVWEVMLELRMVIEGTKVLMGGSEEGEEVRVTQEQTSDISGAVARQGALFLRRTVLGDRFTRSVAGQ